MKEILLLFSCVAVSLVVVLLFVASSFCYFLSCLCFYLIYAAQCTLYGIFVHVCDSNRVLRREFGTKNQRCILFPSLSIYCCYQLGVCVALSSLFVAFALLNVRMECKCVWNCDVEC